MPARWRSTSQWPAGWRAAFSSKVPRLPSRCSATSFRHRRQQAVGRAGSAVAHDALLLAPNQEPIHGRDAAVAFYKSQRDVVGEINDGWELLRVNGNARSASLTVIVTLGSGRIPAWYTDLSGLQPDRSLQIG